MAPTSASGAASSAETAARRSPEKDIRVTGIKSKSRLVSRAEDPKGLTRQRRHSMTFKLATACAALALVAAPAAAQLLGGGGLGGTLGGSLGGTLGGTLCGRSEERRVGNEGVSTGRSGLQPYH